MAKDMVDSSAKKRRVDIATRWQGNGSGMAPGKVRRAVSLAAARFSGKREKSFAATDLPRLSRARPQTYPQILGKSAERLTAA